MEDTLICPVCGMDLDPQHNPHSQGDYRSIDCQRCGTYQVSRTGLKELQDLISNTEARALLSHTIRKMQGGKELPFLNSYVLEEILKNRLPDLSNQVNNLILWLGDNSNPGKKVSAWPEFFQTIMGAKERDGALFVVNYLNHSLIDLLASHSSLDIQLTMQGWQYYDNLKRGAVMSRRAFMAMKFGDADLDFVFNEYFRPAVKATGFDLYRLDEQPRAGLIDDRLRVEIRTSRFLIADLTHGNQGAYWEAGYAEGLGKPVIYACEKNQFAAQKTHFDTNHHLTIIWDKENPEGFSSQLKATIRATLPDEAILTDS